MPEHVLMSEIEIITDGGRRRRWSANEKLRIVEETLEEGTSISVVARRNGVAPNLLYRWRRLMLDGGAVAVSEDDDVTSNRAVRQMEERMRELERQLGRKTLEVEISYRAKERIERPVFGCSFKTGNGFYVYGTNTQIMGQEIEAIEGESLRLRLDDGARNCCTATSFYRSRSTPGTTPSSSTAAKTGIPSPSRIAVVARAYSPWTANGIWNNKYGRLT